MPHPPLYSLLWRAEAERICRQANFYPIDDGTPNEAAVLGPFDWQIGREKEMAQLGAENGSTPSPS